MLFRTRFPWPAAAFVLAAALVPMKSGCAGKTACVKAPAGGGCLSASQATAYFNSSPCGGSSVQSVDGEASFDGEYCCYPVTELPGSSDTLSEVCAAGGAFGETTGFASSGFSSGDAGGFGGFSTTSSIAGTGGGFTDVTATSTGTGGFGGGGGAPPCLSCDMALQTPGGGAPLCDGAVPFASALENCVCSNADCIQVCVANGCDVRFFGTSDCITCIKTNCPNDTMACESN